MKSCFPMLISQRVLVSADFCNKTIWSMANDLQDIDHILSDEILALQDFANREGPQIVSEFFATDFPASLRPQQSEVETYSRQLFRNGVDLLLERWEAVREANSSHPDLDQAGSSNSQDSGYASMPDSSITIAMAGPSGQAPDNLSILGYNGSEQHHETAWTLPEFLECSAVRPTGIEPIDNELFSGQLDAYIQSLPHESGGSRWI
jgi:hypothetical protein